MSSRQSRSQHKPSPEELGYPTETWLTFHPYGTEDVIFMPSAKARLENDEFLVAGPDAVADLDEWR